MTAPPLSLLNLLPVMTLPSTISYQMGAEETQARAVTTPSITDTLLAYALHFLKQLKDAVSYSHTMGMAFSYLQQMEERSVNINDNWESHHDHFYQIRERILNDLTENRQAVIEAATGNDSEATLHQAIIMSLSAYRLAIAKGIHIHLEQIGRPGTETPDSQIPSITNGHAQAAIGMSVALKAAGAMLHQIKTGLRSRDRSTAATEINAQQNEAAATAAKTLDEHSERIIRLSLVRNLAGDAFDHQISDINRQMAKDGANCVLIIPNERANADNTLLAFYQKSVLNVKTLAMPFPKDTHQEEAEYILQMAAYHIERSDADLNALADQVEQLTTMAEAGLHTVSNEEIRDFLATVREITGSPVITHLAAKYMAGDDYVLDLIISKNPDLFQIAGLSQRNAILDSAKDAGLTTQEMAALQNLLAGKTHELHPHPSRLNHHDTIRLLEKAKRINTDFVWLDTIAGLVQDEGIGSSGTIKWLVENSSRSQTPSARIPYDQYDDELL